MSKKKQKTVSQIEYFLDNEPSSLLEIIEDTPDDSIWKEYLEKNNLQDSDSARRYLKVKMGDYLSARDICKRTNIKVKILNKWREKGYLEAEQLKGQWYYSLKSVLNTIKIADIKDLR